eukprot:COSAG03_NODE_411_length_8142_cov_5.225289_7_plen_123_part_00
MFVKESLVARDELTRLYSCTLRRYGIPPGNSKTYRIHIFCTANTTKVQGSCAGVLPPPSSADASSEVILVPPVPPAPSGSASDRIDHPPELSRRASDDDDMEVDDDEQSQHVRTPWQATARR